MHDPFDFRKTNSSHFSFKNQQTVNSSSQNNCVFSDTNFTLNGTYNKQKLLPTSFGNNRYSTNGKNHGYSLKYNDPDDNSRYEKNDYLSLEKENFKKMDSNRQEDMIDGYIDEDSWYPAEHPLDSNLTSQSRSRDISRQEYSSTSPEDILGTSDTSARPIGVWTCSVNPCCPSSDFRRLGTVTSSKKTSKKDTYPKSSNNKKGKTSFCCPPIDISESPRRNRSRQKFDCAKYISKFYESSGSSPKYSSYTPEKQSIYCSSYKPSLSRKPYSSRDKSNGSSRSKSPNTHFCCHPPTTKKKSKKIKCKKEKKIKLKKPKPSSRYENCGFVVFVKKPKSAKGFPVFRNKCLKKRKKSPKIKKFKCSKKTSKKCQKLLDYDCELDQLCKFYQRKQNTTNAMYESLEDDMSTLRKRKYDKTEFLQPSGMNFRKNQVPYQKEYFLNNDSRDIYSRRNKQSMNLNDNNNIGHSDLTCSSDIVIKEARAGARNRSLKKSFQCDNLDKNNNITHKIMCCQIEDLLKSTPDLFFNNKSSSFTKDLVNPDYLFNNQSKKCSSINKNENDNNNKQILNNNNQMKQFEQNRSNESFYKRFFCKKNNLGNKDMSHSENNLDLKEPELTFNNSLGFKPISKINKGSLNLMKINESKRDFYEQPISSQMNFEQQIMNSDQNKTNNPKSIDNVVCSTSHYYIYKLINRRSKNEKKKYQNKMKDENNQQVEEPLINEKKEQKKIKDIKKKKKKIIKELSIEENSAEEVKQKKSPADNNTTCQILKKQDTEPKACKYILPNLTNLISKCHLSKKDYLKEPGCLSLVSSNKKSKKNTERTT